MPYFNWLLSLKPGMQMGLLAKKKITGEKSCDTVFLT
jgi:hypothetical protein